MPRPNVFTRGYWLIQGVHIAQRVATRGNDGWAPATSGYTFFVSP